MNLRLPSAPADALSDPRWSTVKNTILSRALVIASAEQPILSPRGGNQQWMLDLRRAMLDPHTIALIAELLWERMEALYPFQIAGMETAAVPLITALQLAARARGKNINGIIVRKEKKTSGLGRLIEGNLDDTPLIVLDDIVNSAQSLEKVRVVMIDIGVSVAAVFALVDFQSRRGLEWRTRHQIPVQALFTVADLGLQLEQAVSRPARFLFAPHWQHEAKGADPFSVVPKSSPVSDGKHIFVGDDHGCLHAIHPADGSIAWTFTVTGGGRKGTRSTPALHAGRLYVGAYNGTVYCLDSTTGSLIWRFDEADWIGSSAVISVRHQRLYIGVEYAIPGRKGGVLALDIHTGERIWEHPATNFIHCTPCLGPDDAWVACGDNDGYLYCLDADSGKLRWRYRANGAIKSAPVYDAARNHVIAASFDGAMHVVLADSGQLVWKIETDGLLYTTPLLRQNKLFFGSSDKHFYIADLQRQTLERKVSLDGKILAQPVFHAGMIWVGSTGGRLYVLDATDLTMENALQLPDRIVNAVLPLAQHDRIVVPTCDNRLFCFQLQENPAAASLPEQVANLSLPAPASVYRPAPGDINAAISEGLYFRIKDQPTRAATNDFPFLPSRRLLGAAVMLLTASAQHRDLSMAQMMRLLEPAIRHNQLRLFLYGVRPFGLVLWAYPPAAAIQKLVTGRERLTAQEWYGGDTAWLIDVIAPFGGANEMVEKLRKTVLAGKPLTVLRRHADGEAVLETLAPVNG